MIPMRLSEIAGIVGGTLHGEDTLITADVEFDSRKLQPGGLFAAFDGEKADGHAFATGSPAAGVLGSRPTELPTVVVKDVREAMGALARALLGRLPELTVVGITGSSGKTSTKDMIGQLLARLGPAIAPPGTFNN